jgi:hypothetical protein
MKTQNLSKVVGAIALGALTVNAIGCGGSEKKTDEGAKTGSGGSCSEGNSCGDSKTGKSGSCGGSCGGN